MTATPISLNWPEEAPMSPANDGVRFEVDGPVGRITLCRPEARNAQTPETWRALARMGGELPPEVRIVVVTGEGASFSSGLDRALFTPEGLDGTSLLGIAGGSPEDARAFIAEAQSAFAWLAERDVLSIAAVRGHAIGAGFQLALACDLVVAGESASFAMREIAYGIVPDLGGTHPLVRRVGVARAIELCASGRPVDAVEAQRLGLVEAVVADEALAAHVSGLVDALLSSSEPAIRALLPLLRGAPERTLAEQRSAEQDAQLSVFSAMREGRR